MAQSHLLSYICRNLCGRGEWGLCDPRHRIICLKIRHLRLVVVTESGTILLDSLSRAFYHLHSLRIANLCNIYLFLHLSLPLPLRLLLYLPGKLKYMRVEG